MFLLASIVSILIGILCSIIETQSFATPKAEFLLDVDGNSVDFSMTHICALEQKQGTPIGGRARCWGDDFHDIGYVSDVPSDVSSLFPIILLIY